MVYTQSTMTIEELNLKLNSFSGKWLKNVFYSPNNYLVFLYSDIIKVIDCNESHDYSFAVPEDNVIDQYPIFQLHHKSDCLLIKNRLHFIELDLIHLKINLTGKLLDKINALAPDILKQAEDDELWLICKSFSNLVNISSNIEISLREKLDEFDGNCGIFDFIQDEYNNFWILSSYGILKIDKNSVTTKYLSKNPLNSKLYIIQNKVYFMDYYKGLIALDVLTDKIYTFENYYIQSENYGKELIKTKNFLYAFLQKPLTGDITLIKIDNRNEIKEIRNLSPFDNLYFYKDDKFIIRKYNKLKDDYELKVVTLPMLQ